MARLFVIVPALALAAMIFALVDLVRIEGDRVRALPKGAWVLVVVLLPFVGPALWFIVGRARTGGPDSVPRGPVAPDDDPAFLGRLGRDREQEERIRRLEQELSDLDDEQPKD